MLHSFKVIADYCFPHGIPLARSFCLNP